MSECPLCDGVGSIFENKVHFGDSSPQRVLCPACRGSCVMEILPAKKRTITIIKPHGTWCTQAIDEC